jgi:LAO/AO transport system kinase
VQGVVAGDARALARAITLVESRTPEGDALVRDLYPRTGGAVVVGITGPPGVGKSSLVSALIGLLRAGDTTVGVVSVDPSSPFSRGALLGDRIRLSDHFLDPGVFIRSMGTRGHLGGLAESTLQTLLLLDASGKDVLFAETVGTGQSEVEVMGIADVVVLALMPGAGDAVQALKAGIMEIPDVIVVNKADHPGAEAMLAEVRSVVGLEPDPARRPAVLATSAASGEGVAALWDEVLARRAALEERGALSGRRRRNLADDVVSLAAGRLRRRLEQLVDDDGAMGALVEAVQRREVDPLTAVAQLVARVTGEEDGHASDAR